jgi:hypothetical protein
MRLWGYLLNKKLRLGIMTRTSLSWLCLALLVLATTKANGGAGQCTEDLSGYSEISKRKPRAKVALVVLATLEVDTYAEHTIPLLDLYSRKHG